MPGNNNNHQKAILERALALIREAQDIQEELATLAERLGEEFLPQLTKRNKAAPTGGRRWARNSEEKVELKKFHIGDVVMTLTYRPNSEKRKWNLSAEEGVVSVD